jgi:hypothetical protein
MKKHKDALSKTTLKSFNSSKYNKVKRTKTPPDVRKEYIIRNDGWRKREK